jgi:hypothetical protein
MDPPCPGLAKPVSVICILVYKQKRNVKKLKDTYDGITDPPTLLRDWRHFWISTCKDIKISTQFPGNIKKYN